MDGGENNSMDGDENYYVNYPYPSTDGNLKESHNKTLYSMLCNI